MSLAERHPLIVAGGGPAGAAAAAHLAREGFRPLLLERTTAPHHKVCGEFLSWEAQAYLDELGLDLRALGAAPIHAVRISEGAALVEAALPFTGLGLSRRTLDEALLTRAKEFGAEIRRGPVVREVAPEDGQLTVRLRGGEEIAAKTVFLATGKHDLHAPRRPQADNGLIGFKTYWALAPRQVAALTGAVEVALFEGGYAGLQSVEGGMANLCLLARAELFERAGRSWDGLLALLRERSPHLDARLDGAAALLDRPLTISQVPYGFVHRPAAGDPPGLYRLGDQMGVIPSFCGDGMAIALHSAKLAAMSRLGHEQAAVYHRRMAVDVDGPIRLAQGVYGLSRAAPARRGLMAMFRLFPGLVGALARWTRIPAPLIRTG